MEYASVLRRFELDLQMTIQISFVTVGWIKKRKQIYNTTYLLYNHVGKLVIYK